MSVPLRRALPPPPPLESGLRVAGWGWRSPPGDQGWNNSPSMGSGVTLELGHSVIVVVKMLWIPRSEQRIPETLQSPPTLPASSTFSSRFPSWLHRGESRKSCRLHQAPTVRGSVRFWCSLPTADTSSFVPLELRVTAASGSPRYHRIIHINEVGR